MTGERARLERLTVADPPETWRALGFTVDPRGVAAVGGVAVRLGGPAAGRGIAGWALRGSTAAEVDGIPTEPVEGPPPPAGEHPNGAVAVDHVVVATPDFDRTAGALGAAGLELRRVRETATARQGFFPAGTALVELVGPQEPDGDGPASLWGLTIAVADLDAFAERLGDRLGPVRDAVQPGRRIATLRAAAGVSTAVAFMTPRR